MSIRIDPKWLAKATAWGDYSAHPWGRITMWRKGQRVRFYTPNGRQVGPEQANVAPAVAYAMAKGWIPDWDENVTLDYGRLP